jgi:hypothetical protein
MKNSYLIAFVVIVILAAFRSPDNSKDLARVNVSQGLYMFTDSRPVADYATLGTVKAKRRNMSSEQYIGVRDALVIQAKKEYPQADGIILTFVADGTDAAEAIKFK